MTITIRATVRRNLNTRATPDRKWFALAWVEGDDSALDARTRSRIQYAHSHPEALQAAQVLRAEVERELMDEVHASRASRREERCGACRGIANTKHTYLDNCAQPATDLAEMVRDLAFAMNAHYTAGDMHTMEATA